MCVRTCPSATSGFSRRSAALQSGARASGWSLAIVVAIGEAVEIRRRLAQDNPARFAADFQRSLRLLEKLQEAQ